MRGSSTKNEAALVTAPLLSVCIATFNRAAFLGATLQSILAQCDERVEVVIVDGASSDGTADVVRSYQTRFPAFRYVRQSENGGVDRDFNEAVSQASGKYCWLFSDDDILLPGAVATVLRHAGGDYELIIVNAEVRDADLVASLDTNRLKISADRVYGQDEQERLFVDCSDYLTFIGAVVIRKALWETRDRESYFGSLFIHYGVIFQAPLPGRALALAQPLIAIRYGNAMWSSRSFEIWMFKWPALVWTMPFADALRSRVVAREPWRNPMTVLIFRAIGAYGAEEYARFIAPRVGCGAQDVLARISARGIAAVPGVIANRVLSFVLSLLRRSPSTTRIDLKNSRFATRPSGGTST